MKINVQDIFEKVSRTFAKLPWSWAGIAVLAVVLICCVIGYKRGFIKEAVSTLFIFLAIAIVWFINPYVNQFLKENTPLYRTVSESCHEYVDEKLQLDTVVGSQEQTEAIQDLNLPAFVTQGLEENNKASIYNALGVTSFVDYLTDYLAGIITNGISFLVSFVLATILIRVLAFLLNVFASLPVIRGVNKLAGAVLGGGKCVIYVWIAMLLLTVLCNTEIGKKGLEMVHQDRILEMLYRNNLLAELFTGITYGLKS